MTTEYKVTSNRLGRKRGETLTADELGGANVAALVAGGHLQEVVPVKTTGHKATKQEG